MCTAEGLLIWRKNISPWLTYLPEFDFPVLFWSKISGVTISMMIFSKSPQGLDVSTLKYRLGFPTLNSRIVGRYFWGRNVVTRNDAIDCSSMIEQHLLKNKRTQLICYLVHKLSTNRSDNPDLKNSFFRPVKKDISKKVMYRTLSLLLNISSNSSVVL